MRRGLVLMAVVALQFSTPVIAGHVAGRAGVIDGDTIEIRSQRIRISGVDAPEAGQVCYSPSGRQWRCGQRAALMLADHIGAGPVSCRTEGQDRFGRWLARCTAHGQDLGEWLVRNGWAVPYFDHNHAYAEAQRAARASRAGIGQASSHCPKTGGNCSATKTQMHLFALLDVYTFIVATRGIFQWQRRFYP